MIKILSDSKEADCDSESIKERFRSLCVLDPPLGTRVPMDTIWLAGSGFACVFQQCWQHVCSDSPKLKALSLGLSSHLNMSLTVWCWKCDCAKMQPGVCFSLPARIRDGHSQVPS